MILAGDTGGTKTRLALFDEGDLVRPVAEKRYTSRDFSGLDAIVSAFLIEHPAALNAAAFGIAGPVYRRRCRATNLPWIIEGAVLERCVGIPVTLLNDLEATAFGALLLPEEDIAVLNPGRPDPQGALGIIAAGTGLGEAGLLWDGARYRSLPTESGHADFAPRNELEAGLWRFLLKRHGRVSYEHVLSGPGKVAVYEYLREAGYGEEPQGMREAYASGDPSPAITEFGLDGSSELCSKALDVFVSILGAEAGNLALRLLARGGVYLGGGIAPTLLPRLQAGLFMEAFCAKGKLGELLRDFPVKVIRNDRAALFGAAFAARHSLGAA